MKNTKLYPFERNNYFPGKMLTSADFQAEQNYFNNKRRFMNNLMYGAGVICGCGVFSLDDLSILIESGVAIDGLGREIVMENSVVKKLSAMEGFESLKTNLVSLCIRYQEQPMHTIYTINQSDNEGQEYEYNRISEGYQLFLMDQEDAVAEYEMESEFLTELPLLQTEDYMIKLVMPATVCRGRNVKMEVCVVKCSSERKKLTYHGILQTPTFVSEEGKQEVEIRLEDVILAEGEQLKKEYWLAVSETALLNTTILLKSGTISAFVEDMEAEALESGSLNIAISEHRPGELISREIGRMSLEMRNMGSIKDYIRLADLRLVRTERAYIIDEIHEKEVKNYIVTPAQEMLRNEYMEYFVKRVDIFKKKRLQKEEPAMLRGFVAADRTPQVATGILEIPLGESARKGSVFYSGEIMHGLGSGDIYIELGQEQIYEDVAMGASSRTTIYGNGKLFQESENNNAEAETAIKVLNDKGSFIVAAKLKEHTDAFVLTYRWVAMKFSTGEEIEEPETYSEKSILAETPTVIMGTKESYYFQVRFKNMERCSIAYELTENGSGEITSEGVYTAPAKEGVYEIKIYCIDMPNICTYAYAIVKRTGKEDTVE